MPSLRKRKHTRHAAPLDLDRLLAELVTLLPKFSGLAAQRWLATMS